MDSKKTWKEFQFIDIFYINEGFYNKRPKENEYGNIPFIGATNSNNGVTQFCDIKTIEKTSKTGDNNNAELKKKLFDGNCICVTNNGSVGYAYYQKNKFTCTHDVNPLYLKKHVLNEEIALFLIGAIEQQRVCFRYSRKWRPMRMKKSKILLPVDAKGNPDYDYMENYIHQIKKEKIEKYIEFSNKKIEKLGKKVDIKPLSEIEWKEFFVTDIFGNNIQRGKRLIRENQLDGTTPYISSTSLNNGVDNFIEAKDNMRKFKNCLSVANSGSVGSSFYEPFEFVASDHITHLENCEFNEYIYLFIATMTTRWSEKYNFNREINDDRISREKILLPIRKDGNPDYEYMENYIKNLMISKYKKYCIYNENKEKINA